MWTTDGDRILVSKKIADDLKSLTADHLSSHEAVSDVRVSQVCNSAFPADFSYQIFMGKYVGMHKRDKWGVDVIRSDLTRALGTIYKAGPPEMFTESRREASLRARR